jgi:ssDNA thymidine ADP-ribosyltransferase, DarT
MSQTPADPHIYHITHLDNLASIVGRGELLADAAIIEQGGPAASIGMSAIKKRRIEELAVDCHPNTRVGDYVPFYFCPRSIMLYVIHCANHPDLTYKGGQEPIVHLEADLRSTIRWADTDGRKWAFSLSNAGSYYAQFRSSIANLDEINWDAIAATDFRPADVREGKQAEFLVHERFPWRLVSRIGVRSMSVRVKVDAILKGADYAPKIEIKPDWYF